MDRKQELQNINAKSAAITTPLLHQALYMLAQNQNTPQGIRDTISNPIQNPVSNNENPVINGVLNALYKIYAGGANNLKNVLTGNQQDIGVLNDLIKKSEGGSTLSPDETKFINRYANNNALAVASNSGGLSSADDIANNLSGIMNKNMASKYNRAASSSLNEMVDSVAPANYGSPLINPKPQQLVERDTQEALRRYMQSKYSFTK